MQEISIGSSMSQGIVELVMTFEEAFRCAITDDDAPKILTVGDAVKFLEKNAIT
jgi:acyl carrier protein